MSSTVTQLVASLRPPTSRSWESIAALARIGDQESLDALVDLTHDQDWRFRRAAVGALAQHPLGRLAATQVCDALRDDSPYVVRTACESADRLQLAAAHDPIVELVGSRTGPTRLAAIRALSSLWRDSDFELLLGFIRHDAPQSVRREAAWTLKRNASATAWTRLVDVWLADPLARHRVWACELIAQFGDRNSASQLEQLVDDPDGHVRKAAMAALDVLKAQAN